MCVIADRRILCFTSTTRQYCVTCTRTHRYYTCMHNVVYICIIYIRCVHVHVNCISCVYACVHSCVPLRVQMDACVIMHATVAYPELVWWGGFQVANWSSLVKVSASRGVTLLFFFKTLDAKTVVHIDFIHHNALLHTNNLGGGGGGGGVPGN